MGSTLNQDADQVCELVAGLATDRARTIIGIAGPPASGKSTLAERVVEKLNGDPNGSVDRAALLPMDGYHLDNRILKERGLLARKGAPETFNAEGFCQAVRQLAETEQEGIFPKFDRQLDKAIANAIVISPQTPVVVVEGNYLLLDSQPWKSMRDVFSATVFVSPSIEVLRERLHQRWIDHGLDSDAAMARATLNDLPNAETVIRHSRRADLHLSQA